jgi:tRNA(Ile)-lysidine synthase
MRNQLEQRVLRSVRESRMIPAGSRVAVACSGGADSIALLRLLATLRGDLGIVVMAAHLNHGLRGVESDGDEAFVEATALEIGVAWVRERVDVAVESERSGWNLEDAGRRARQAFFERLAGSGRADGIAVAHTADDQAETVLAQMIRGTGPTGLAGIFPTSGHVVRPLLEFRREELRAYLREIGQNWREDSSNGDTTRLRARIRAKLVPQLRAEFSPTIVEHLNTLAQLSREENEFWEALVESRFSILAACRNGTIEIAAADLLEPLPLVEDSPTSASPGNGSAVSPLRALTERLIRRLYKGVRGELRELTALHVANVIRLAAGDGQCAEVELPGGIVAGLSLGRLTFQKAERHEASAPRISGTSQEKISYQYCVESLENGEQTVAIPELNTPIRLKVIDWSGMESDTKRETPALDADLMRFPLILRSWRPGDAYRPKGRSSAKKLKELLLANRVPAGERATWPVLESEGQIVWALGLPPSADHLVSKATKRGLVIEEAGFPASRRK